jgi:hypothetical protein
VSTLVNLGQGFNIDYGFHRAILLPAAWHEYQNMCMQRDRL